MQGRVSIARGLRRGLTITVLFLGVALAAPNLAAAQSGLSISGTVRSGGFGLLGVNVELRTAGLTIATTTTALDGTYTFSDVAPGTYTVTPTKTNYTITPPSQNVEVLVSSVSGVDFTATLNQHTISGQVSLDGVGLPGAAMSLTGTEAATATTDGNGNYSFTNLDAAGDYTVTPTAANHTFAPPNRSYSNLIANQTGQNFAATLIRLSLNDVTVAEGAGNATFTASLKDQSGSPVASNTNVTFNASTANGSAQAGSDFTALTNESFSVPAGASSATFQVPLSDDVSDEADETFVVNLSGVVNADLQDGDAQATITDDDNPPVLSISSESHLEGNSSTTTYVFTVTLSPASGKTVTVNFNTQNGTAVSGGIAPQDDYENTSGSLTFNPGETSKTIPVLVNGDTINEATETFSVNLFGAVDANLPPGGGTGTIGNDDGAPSLSVADLTVGEGVGPATFTVTLAPSSGQTVQVNYATQDGPAPAATSPADYTGGGNLLSFAPGETTKTISVPIVQDALDEQNEKFTVALSNESNATVAKRGGIGTITDDDQEPTVSIGNAPAVTEGGVASFPVTLSAASGQAVSVQYSTSNGTAFAPGDFAAATNLTLSFAPGETTESIPIQTNDDLVDENDAEIFTVSLSGPTNSSIATGQGTGSGTINDNDALPTVSIGNASTVSEGATTNFAVTLSPASGRQVTVNYAVAHGTTSAADFTGATSGAVTFAAGDTSETISIATVNDSLDELDSESFTVVLSSPNSATVDTGTGNGSIDDNDPMPTVSIANAPTVAEGAVASFPVTLSVVSGRQVTANYSVANGTTSAADFTGSPSGTVTFAPGDPLTKQVSIQTADDTLDEPSSETFTVTLTSPSNATITDGPATGTINDNDNAPTVTIANASAATEGGNASFPVTLSAASGQTVTVNYSTAHGTTTAGDFAGSLSGTVAFAPGDPLTKPISIGTVDDALDEADSETFTVTLAGPSNASLGTPSSGTGTINDNDAAPSISIADGSAFEGNSVALGTCGAAPPPGQTPTGCIFLTVTLSTSSGLPVTVQYSTANGTATTPADYAAVSATTITFAPGETTKTIGVAPLTGIRLEGDASKEPNETVNVNLASPTNATISDGLGVGTIVDDDGEPALSITGSRSNEAEGGGLVVVRLSPSSAFTVTVNITTANGSAIAGSDYTGIPPAIAPCDLPALGVCKLTFQPGQTSKAVTIPLLPDTLDEFDEVFSVVLSGETDAEVRNGQDRTGVVTIIDDPLDGAPVVSVGDATVTEGNASTVSASFSIGLDAPSGKPIEVSYATANGTALEPQDYTATSGLLTFNPGETTKTVTVPVIGDLAVEPDETFNLNLSNGANAQSGDVQGLGTIQNDDNPPPPPPPPPEQPPPPTTTTSTSTSTSTATLTRPTTTTPQPPTFGGNGISGAPVTLLENLAPVGITCSKQAKGSCSGTIVLQSQTRALAIVHGRSVAKTRTLGRERYAIPRGRTEKVLVRLSKAAVKAVKRTGKLKVTVVLTGRDSAGRRAKTISQALWLKSAKQPKARTARKR